MSIICNVHDACHIKILCYNSTCISTRCEVHTDCTMKDYRITISYKYNQKSHENELNNVSLPCKFFMSGSLMSSLQLLPQTRTSIFFLLHLYHTTVYLFSKPRDLNRWYNFLLQMLCYGKQSPSVKHIHQHADKSFEMDS